MGQQVYQLFHGQKNPWVEYNMVTHSQSSHMYHQPQSWIMSQPCLWTVTVTLSAGQLECAVRPWPPQSCWERPLRLYPHPLSFLLSISRPCLEIYTASSLSLDKNTLSQALHLASSNKAALYLCVRAGCSEEAKHCHTPSTWRLCVVSLCVSVHEVCRLLIAN